MRREDQERILTEVRSRVADQVIAAAEGSGTPVEEVLAGSVYHERRRLNDERPGKARKADESFWDDVQPRLGPAGPREQETLLRQVVSHYAEEVVGNFDERVYQVATRALPTSLGLLLNAVSPKRLITRLPDGAPWVEDNLVVQGEVEHLRRLHELGTVILTPTHVSNMDSIIAGFSIYRMGLPPFVYGAGLNLFSNPVLGFFMHNLGAYTVDRRKTDPLYKEVLKTYATLTLEYGYDNLFFPGGTRSRSGAVESRLKMGLLGCGLSAYIHNLRRGSPSPRVFVVPATLSYQLVLEAQTLVDDFLKEVGRSRYIITDDEFSRPTRVWDFVSKLFSHDARIYVTVGRGFDPFGNPVDDEGRSLDPRERPIDIARYVLEDDEPRHRPQRDAEFTRELGERLVEAFHRDNVIQSTHLLARAVFSLLRRHNPSTDLVRLVRLGGRHEDLELREVYRQVRALLETLRGKVRLGELRLSPAVIDCEAEEVVADGLKHFAIYHDQPAATRRGDRIFATDKHLLFYYQNRLEGYGLEAVEGLPPALGPDHRQLNERARIQAA